MDAAAAAVTGFEIYGNVFKNIPFNSDLAITHIEKNKTQAPTSKIDALIQYYNTKSRLERQLEDCVAQVHLQVFTTRILTTR